MLQQPQEEASFRLAAADDDATPPVLTGVQAEGEVAGALFTLTLRQRYRNDGPRNLEVVYSFPLPARAVLLGFAATLGGRRLEGRVLPRREAEETYEKALAEGDAPVLLEASSSGVHTASVGNLKPGEEIEVEVRFGQPLAFEQGRLRLAVPATIAPRYGAPAEGGLLPHQEPVVSQHVSTPLTFAITVRGALAQGALECPTHPADFSPVANGMRMALAGTAWLDRDVVLLVTPKDGAPQVLALGRDAVSATAPVVALAAFGLPVAPTPASGAARLQLKLLVDCSGSMGGESIDSARRALRSVVDALDAEDEASLSRFGTGFDLAVPPGLCTWQLRRRLRSAVAATDARMGGTEMANALKAVFALPSRGEGGDVLLITDGEVWGAEELTLAARRSGHRVFAIGVGTSPAEAVLRDLAQASGGACEFATPGESLEQAAMRMLQRMRQPVWSGLRVEWGQPDGQGPDWALPVAPRAFGGDTVLSMAGFASAPAPGSTLRLLADGDDEGKGGRGPRVLATLPVPAGLEVSPDDDMARLAAHTRMLDLGLSQAGPAQQLALDYQLVSQWTHCVLVHERAEEDKPAEAAEMHRVRSMLAAGWGSAPDLALGGASGSVWRSARSSVTYDQACLSLPPDAADILSKVMARHNPDSRSPRSSGSARPSSPPSQGAAPRGLRFGKNPLPEAATLREICETVREHFAAGGVQDGLVACCAQLPLADELMPVWPELRRLAGGHAAAWLLLALWVAERPAADGLPEAVAELRWHLTVAGLSDDTLEAARQFLQRTLGGYSSVTWKAGRLERIRRRLVVG